MSPLRSLPQILVLAVALVSAVEAAPPELRFHQGNTRFEGKGIVVAVGTGEASFEGTGVVRAKGEGKIRIPAGSRYRVGQGEWKPAPKDEDVELQGEGYVVVQLQARAKVVAQRAMASLEARGEGTVELAGKGLYAVRPHGGELP